MFLLVSIIGSFRFEIEPHSLNFIAKTGDKNTLMNILRKQRIIVPTFMLNEHNKHYDILKRKATFKKFENENLFLKDNLLQE